MIRDFGTTSNGHPVCQVTIGAGGLRVRLLTLGAILQEVRLADIDHSLTLGSERLADYETTMPFHGPLIGPVANRISNARVRLDGMTYELERNQNGRIHLHSGADATQHRIWDITETREDSVTFTTTLPDGLCGLPGRRHITARFQVTAPASLTLEITGTTDAKTLMNFANHSYWNLDGTDTYDGHRLWIDADAYLPTDADICPTGEIATVAGTDMDFRTPRALSAGSPALDTNFCLSDGIMPLRDVLHLAGQSGIGMTLATTCPGLQVYDGRAARRPGRAFHEGLAIEAQHWPDAPNNRAFPGITVTPDAPYRQVTRWSFQPAV